MALFIDRHTGKNLHIPDSAEVRAAVVTVHVDHEAQTTIPPKFAPSDRLMTVRAVTVRQWIRMERQSYEIERGEYRCAVYVQGEDGALYLIDESSPTEKA